MRKTEHKREGILASATRVISEKGFADATVSEIANGADLAGSGIYTYFKSKEDVLFAIIDNFLSACFDGLKEHLAGIQGAENKLRKAIWFHCRVYSGNKKEIKIILESRSYPRFYASAAYETLRNYAGLITEIIREGMDDGTFSGLFSPIIVRDMILGTVDHIAINWTIKDSPNSMDQADKIADMVLRSLSKGRTTQHYPNKKDARKKRVINSAIALFAENGFNDTSMLQIARRAGVAEGTVYEYFRSKQNLLISIPNEKLGELYDHISGNTLENEIREIISKLFRFYNDEKNYTTILVLMLRTNKAFHRSEGIQIIEKIFNVMKDIITRGQAEGVFKPDLDMDLCQDLLFGTIDHITIPWIMFNRDYDLLKVGEAVSRLFINAIRA
ncbi:MAG: TetR/AcrR family transcriptional regulator [Desulfobacterales bacterium]|nr:TetR/AcrR family transcriptional regulator [Desulfobacterales bacterium]